MSTHDGIPADGRPPSAVLPSHESLRRGPGPRSSGRAPSIALAAVLLIAGTLVAVHVYAPAPQPVGIVQVVAAENFWGSLVAQLGGSHVSVLSIVSDPNADPHEYESNISDAVAVADARLVIVNGAGYDSWCSNLISAGNSPDQIVLDVGTLLGKVAGDNPHFWYGAPYVNATIAAMYSDLVAIDPTDVLYFQQQYASLNASLGTEVFNRENAIRAEFGGTAVASTESIFEYLASSTGLDLISPTAFMDAVAEGNDPPASSVTDFQDQLESGLVGVLVYNAQTVTPLTDQMRSIAAAHNVSVTALTETIQPAGATFQAWMGAELLSLENALRQKVLLH